MSRTHTEATRAKIRQKARERYEWDDAKVERIKALVLSGASSREIARQERVYRGTLKRFCDEHGLARKERRGFTPRVFLVGTEEEWEAIRVGKESRRE